ncbi:MAG: tetratricopeptide repeat protein [Nitrospinae bacterium]|nr:tetratricopeptide repeat protein [Nitrospinota bacterium]MBI3813153.1 tetratricopeptide repeat protein [Nitrospinota bacterium]
MDEAIHEFQIALKLNPDYIIAHNNIGIADKEKGLVEGVILMT